MFKPSSVLMMSVPAVLASGSSTPAPVIVDDAMIEGELAAGWHRLSKTKGLSCGIHSWKQDFIYATSQNSIDFHANLPKHGCYLVEEFHPAECDQPLSKAVEVTFDYCASRQFKATIDQSTGGNRWNPVAMLPFYDPRYGISVKALDNRIAITDAFRYTWIADECPKAEVNMTGFVRLAAILPAAIVDDSNSKKSGSATSHQCSSGVMGTAHTVDDGEGSVEYRFEPPSTGCYRIDEFHPKATESCPVKANSKLNVEYCLGGKHEIHVDLSSNGGHWNTVNHYMFYAGVTGKVTASRSLSAAAGSLWAADAFRFTKVGDWCSQVPQTARASLHISGVDLEGSEVSNGLASHSSLRLNILGSISSKLGFASESIALNFRKGSIIVDLQLSGHPSELESASNKLSKSLGDMSSSLCKAAGAADLSLCNVELTHLSVVPSPTGWGPVRKPQSREDSPFDTDNATFMIVAGGACFAMAMCIGLVVVAQFLKKYQRSTEKQQEATMDAVTSTPDKVIVVDPTQKDAVEAISDCASTATPSDTAGEVTSPGDNDSLGSAHPTDTAESSV